MATLIAVSVLLFMAWAVHAFVEAVSEFDRYEGDEDLFDHSEGGTEL